jgi:hypothetical protein
MAYHGESLTRGTPKDHIYVADANSCSAPDFGSGQPHNRSRQHRALGKVVGVDSAVDGVDFNRGHDIETGLLEAQAKTSGTRKQIDSDRPWHPKPPAFRYQLTRFRATCRSEFFPGARGRK